MFWSANNTNVSQSSPAPENRRQGSSSAAAMTNISSTPFIAPTIRGSIRPPAQAPSTSRQEHLDSYLNDETLKRSTRRVSPDDSTYDTVFQSIFGDTLILRVHWPVLTEQTQQPPSMTLAGVNAQHPWLDGRMCIVGYEPITSYRTWIASKIKLGAAVHDVVTHLQVNPPEIFEITDAGLRSIQQPKTVEQIDLQKKGARTMRSSDNILSSTSKRTATSCVIAPVGKQQQSNFSHEEPPGYDTVVSHNDFLSPDISMPTIPTQFVEINKLNKNELQNLLDDEVEFIKFCSSLPVIQTYGKMLQSVIEENAAIAKKNLSKQEELESLYKDCNNLETELELAVEKFLLSEEKQNALCQQPDVKLVIKELTSAKKVAFDESEDIARKWLDNMETMSVDVFLETFVSKRKLHHERAAKLELLQASVTSMSR